jgi:Rod binding domain-containing protein
MMMNALSPVAPPTVPAGQTSPAANDERLRAAAAQLEGAFLTEMLRAAGVGEARSSFGGGAGEEQFSAFLLERQAQEMVKAGGIGLAQSLFEAMKSGDRDA